MVIISYDISDINNKFMKLFERNDSVYIFQLSNTCKVQKFGFAKNEDSPLLIVT